MPCHAPLTNLDLPALPFWLSGFATPPCDRGDRDRAPRAHAVRTTWRLPADAGHTWTLPGSTGRVQFVLSPADTPGGPASIPARSHIAKSDRSSDRAALLRTTCRNLSRRRCLCCLTSRHSELIPIAMALEDRGHLIVASKVRRAPATATEFLLAGRVVEELAKVAVMGIREAAWIWHALLPEIWLLVDMRGRLPIALVAVPHDQIVALAFTDIVGTMPS
mmetsp:Transcript_62166/g.170808  ORF Transcript_62166/g.170808 Transcript_62166/m.170808 type:complete len:220 (+) Transcript_62166:16-675(+)